MNKLSKYAAIALAGLSTLFSCDGNEDYTLDELNGPSDIQIIAEVVGQDESNPNGDGSGDVLFTITAKNAINYKIDFDESDGINMESIPGGMTTKKYTTIGTETYTVNVVAYGAGGSSSNASTSVSVRFEYQPDPEIVTNLTNNASKTWAVDPSLPGHMGVGPWDFDDYTTPNWWASGVNEKVGVADCLYSSTYTFGYDEGANSYTLDVHTPEGAFTKTGNLSAIPNIPESGDEGCYSYSDSSSSFSFIPSSSILDESLSTRTSIVPNDTFTFVAFGHMIREYEILEVTPDYLYIRSQGTGEPWTAWYFKLTPVE
ncbi:hypothetical protein E7Z59_04235 [Robertkochia marina]|uniref:Glucan endo-1,3-beta-D-glucosidase n=1 Tax=Robertkochia marina TaxID=1227945 RepID=A0A4S3M326_9FLAO|nr:hypothetical protein [Robertkochia marina]THD69544.1 hypothetical protein E7Z59_04235 [Robertkochia marina]TRZ47198.1 hypothetical protein D3A96_00335 [Robertkochia marina]